MSRLLVFDLETKRSADEVGGWSNIMDMGMSVGVLWDSSDDKYHVYLEHQVSALVNHLKQGDQIVGFNHIEFDMRVVAGHQVTNELRHQQFMELRSLNNLDLLVELKKVLGHRLKLESVARPTLGTGKSADGLQALQWYKEGRMDLIISYCKQDVEVTRRVYEYALEHQGKLLYESRAGIKEVTIDLNLKPTVEAPVTEQMNLFE